MKVLVDTCVLAELRKPQGHPRVKQILAQLPDDAIYLSVLTLGEINKGISLLPSGAKKQDFLAWLGGLQLQFADRILPVDFEVGQIWGELTARAQADGMSIPAVDGLIAATAICNGLHVMTRNTRHFATSGALVLDPWEM